MMEGSFQNYTGGRRASYISVSGVITEIASAIGLGYGGCTQMMTVEDEEGGLTNFLVHGCTCVADQEKLYEGMSVTVYYRSDPVAALVYPPRFAAAAIVPQAEGRMSAVAYFNQVLMASDQSLKLNLSPATEVVTCNNQFFPGNPGGHVLLVLYSQATRSNPPQTTPDKIVVLCNER